MRRNLIDKNASRSFIGDVPDDKRHVRWLYDELPLWREQGWLSDSNEAQIRAHYGPVPEADYRRLTAVLISVLAALLIGGGVILILAHNWDDLSRPVRAALSVLPLLVTYVLAAFVLRSRTGSAVWTEGVAVGNVCASAAAVALVAQTYNISGDTASYFFTVSLLALPAVYLFRSVGAALLYLVGIVVLRWAADGYGAMTFHGHGWECFWGMLALLAPIATLKLREGATHGARLLALGLLIAVGVSMIPQEAESLEVAAVFALFFSSVVGLSAWGRTSAYLYKFVPRLALFGLFVILLILSFGDNWRSSYSGLWSSSIESGALLCVLALCCGALLFEAIKARDTLASIWTGLGLALALICALMHGNAFLAVPEFAVNLLGLSAGAATMVLGYRAGRMLLVNGGLTVLSGILLMRFFDEDLPMVMRGVGFIVLGAVFIYVNTRLSRKMKENRS